MGGEQGGATHICPRSHQLTDVPGVEEAEGVQRFGCTDQSFPGLNPDLHAQAGLGASAEDEVCL